MIRIYIVKNLIVGNLLTKFNKIVIIYYNLKGNNMYGEKMKIIKSKQYIKDYNKKLYKLHKTDEIIRVKRIEDLIIDSTNLKSLILNPLSKVYHIEQKKGNLREIYTARINGKMRIFMKPLGEYPYDLMEIMGVESLKIDNNHYNDG